MNSGLLVSGTRRNTGWIAASGTVDRVSNRAQTIAAHRGSLVYRERLVCMSVKVGLIGCGRQAPKHISGLAAWSEVDIIVADDRPERAAALAASHQVHAVGSAEEIFTDPEIAAVSICTPPASHVDLIRRAIAAGKHFICEKPLTSDPAEAKALERETERAGLVGMVGYIYRFAPAFQFGADVLAGARSGGEAAALGTISSALFRLGGPGSHKAWQHQRTKQGGAINEMMVHMVDLAIWYFGSISQARLIASQLRNPMREIRGHRITADAEDWVLGEMTSHAGVRILIEADLTTPTFVQYAEVQGTNGTFMGSIRHDLASFVQCLEPRSGFKAGRTDCEFGARNLFEAQMGMFADCVTGRAVLDRCTLGESVQLMEVVEMMRANSCEISSDRASPATWLSRMRFMR